MKSFKNFLVEKENPNNPSEKKPQISKSDAKKNSENEGCGS